MKIILCLALLTDIGPTAPTANSSPPAAVVKVKTPQSCSEARQAQAAASGTTGYSDSYSSADEMRREIRNLVSLLCDETVDDPGARSIWKTIDGTTKKHKMPKPRAESGIPPD